MPLYLAPELLCTGTIYSYCLVQLLTTVEFVLQSCYYNIPVDPMAYTLRHSRNYVTCLQKQCYSWIYVLFAVYSIRYNYLHIYSRYIVSNVSMYVYNGERVLTRNFNDTH